ncbi:MAG: Hsp70 family protein, partial [Micromonosporaceae bacterium]
RRLFWEDVRGAKEMLSRTSVAPVPVPGVDEALHVTREELEQLARPLLNRAVDATAAVIDECRLSPGQLAGVFLVGGTSRIPLVAQLLHTSLGVAPTALEQPELPVAEGALAELVAADSPATFLAAAPSSPGPSSPGPSGPGSGGVPDLPAAPFAPLGPPRSRPWYRKPWVYAAAAGLAVVMLAGVLVYYLGRTERPFDKLTSVAAVPMPGEAVGTDIEDGRGYLAAKDENGTLRLTSVDLETGETVTKRQIGPAETWEDFGAQSENLLVYGQTEDQYGSSERTLHLLDAATLKEVYTDRQSRSIWHFMLGDRLIRVDPDANVLAWIDPASGKQVGTTTYGYSFFRVGNWDDESTAASLSGDRFEQPYPDDRLVTVDEKGTLRVLSGQNGKVMERTPAEVLDASDFVMAYQGMFLVAGPVTDGGGYQVKAYDLDKPGAPRQIFRDKRDDVTPQRIEPCGETYLCVVNSANELVVIDFRDGGKVWSRKLAAPEEIATIVPVDDRIMVNHQKGDTVRNVIFDSGGGEIRRAEGWGTPVDAGSGLLFDPSVATFSGGNVSVSSAVMSVELTGIGAQSGSETVIGGLDARPSTCSWDDAHIACAGSSQFLVYRFRDG